MKGSRKHRPLNATPNCSLRQREKVVNGMQAKRATAAHKRSEPMRQRSQAKSVSDVTREARAYRDSARLFLGRDAWGFLVNLALWCEAMTRLGHEPRLLDVRP